MKKHLFLKNLMVALLLLMGMSAWAASVTFTPGQDSAEGTTLTKSGITLTATTFNNATYYQVYKSQNFTISSAVGNITSVIITCTVSGTAKYGPGCFTDETTGSYTFSGTTGTWTGDATSFTMTASSNQVRMTSVVVTYTESEDATKAPTFSVSGGTYKSAQSVEITSATEGADIYYTIDGSTPSSASTLYTSAISITETTTVKAIAIKNGVASTVESVTYILVLTTGQGTLDNPYTISDVILLNNTNENAWVIGTIYGIYSDNEPTETVGSVNSNIALTDGNNYIPVQLPTNSTIRTALNLVNNPQLKGTVVKVKGDLQSYFTKTGVKNVSEYEFTTEAITISEAGYVTYFNADHAVELPTGVTGYVWAYDALQEVYVEGYNVIPAGEPVVLHAAAGPYTLNYTTTEYPSWKSANANDLEGAATAMTAAEMATANPGNNKFYALSLNAAGDVNSVGFYYMNENGAAFDAAAGKAYLVLSAANAPERILFNQNPVATDIENAAAIKATKALVNGNIVIIRNGAKFNLSGMLVK